MKSLPSATKFRWTFNNTYETNEISANKLGNKKLPEKKNDGNHPFYYSSLKYHAKTEKDFGEVRCFATNVLGESDYPCIFTLIPAGKHRLLTKLI